jgi:hypothetical protein
MKTFYCLLRGKNFSNQPSAFSHQVRLKITERQAPNRLPLTAGKKFQQSAISVQLSGQAKNNRATAPNRAAPMID